MEARSTGWLKLVEKQATRLRAKKLIKGQVRRRTKQLPKRQINRQTEQRDSNNSLHR